MKLVGLAHGGEANPLLHMVKSTVLLHGQPHGARSVLISLLSLALRPHRCVLSGRKRDARASVFTHQQVNDPGGGRQIQAHMDNPLTKVQEAVHASIELDSCT